MQRSTSPQFRSEKVFPSVILAAIAICAKAGADKVAISRPLGFVLPKLQSPSWPRPQKNLFLRAFLKSVIWYAYRNGFSAELTCDKIMKASRSHAGTWQTLQKAWTQLTVYKGIQHTMKKTTIMARFLAVLTSRLLACWMAGLVAAGESMESGDCRRCSCLCRLRSELDVDPGHPPRWRLELRWLAASWLLELWQGSCCSRDVICRSWNRNKNKNIRKYHYYEMS